MSQGQKHHHWDISCISNGLLSLQAAHAKGGEVDEEAAKYIEQQLSAHQSPIKQSFESRTSLLPGANFNPRQPPSEVPAEPVLGNGKREQLQNGTPTPVRPLLTRPVIIFIPNCVTLLMSVVMTIPHKLSFLACRHPLRKFEMNRHCSACKGWTRTANSVRRCNCDPLHCVEHAYPECTLSQFHPCFLSVCNTGTTSTFTSKEKRSVSSVWDTRQ